MALGHRIPNELPAVIATADLVPAPAHPFYQRLNRVLQEADFDSFVEDLCHPYYAEGLGRPGIPPGVYFRMLFVGYFEGLDSQRGIAWRCSDSRSLRDFLGYLPTEATPDHSSLTKVRQRLPEVVHEEVFAWVLRLADANGLRHGRTVGVDSTFLEANAAMKAIQRRDTGDDWKAYLRKLAAADGLEDPSDEVLAAEVYPADQPDSATLLPSVASAQVNLLRADSDVAIEEAVTDKGYHKVQTLAECAGAGVRTYIGEQRRPQGHVWTDKPAGWEKAYRHNRRRAKGVRGRRLQRKRSEYVERTFAHVCETGGARRSWLRGVVEVSKRYLMQVAGHNLGVIMRRLSGNGTPRSLQGACAALMAWIRAWWRPALPPECMRARVWSEPDTHAWQEARHYWWISTH